MTSEQMRRNNLGVDSYLEDGSRLVPIEGMDEWLECWLVLYIGQKI